MNTAESPASEPSATNALRSSRSARSGHVVSRDGTRIAYDRVGSGPPVIVVVGALCSRTLGPGVKLAPLLAARFTVFTYDRRGRGDSGDGTPYAIEREVEDLEALLVEAGGAACVVGHSSGAVLALRSAEHGLPITKLALYEPPFIVDDARPSTEDDWARIEAFARSGRPGDAVKAFMKSVGVPAFAVALMRWLPIWKSVTKVAHTLPYDGALVQEFQRGAPLPATAWARVTTPALAIDGGKSPTWMRNGTRALATVLPNARYRTLEGQTHDVSARALAPVLDEFFGSPVLGVRGTSSS
jgi:pimeloyl-ACP methyl ester carboxylesterase